MSISLPEPAVSPPEPFSLCFTLPFALPSLNVRLRTHPQAYKRQRQNLSLSVMAAIGGPRYFPRPPLRKARVSVIRYSPSQLDADNLMASCKGLVDVLCNRTRIHPDGLGIIEDDRPDQCEIVASQQRGKAGTTVLVDAVEAVGKPVDVMSERRVPRQVSEPAA